jgi:hypothetical protein
MLLRSNPCVASVSDRSPTEGGSPKGNDPAASGAVAPAHQSNVPQPIVRNILLWERVSTNMGPTFRQRGADFPRAWDRFSASAGSTLHKCGTDCSPPSADPLWRPLGAHTSATGGRGYVGQMTEPASLCHKEVPRLYRTVDRDNWGQYRLTVARVNSTPRAVMPGCLSFLTTSNPMRRATDAMCLSSRWPRSRRSAGCRVLAMLTRGCFVWSG